VAAVLAFIPPEIAAYLKFVFVEFNKLRLIPLPKLAVLVVRVSDKLKPAALSMDKGDKGVLVPIPTFPEEVTFILIDGVEPVTKRISLSRSDVDCKIKLPELKKGY
jgi:hypothetical protein